MSPSDTQTSTSSRQGGCRWAAAAGRARRARHRAARAPGRPRDACRWSSSSAASFFDLADFFHRLKRFVRVANSSVVVGGRLITDRLAQVHDRATGDLPEAQGRDHGDRVPLAQGGGHHRRRDSRRAVRHHSGQHARGRGGLRARAPRPRPPPRPIGRMKLFLTDLWHDLREKRLWPVAALLLLGARGRARRAGQAGRKDSAAGGRGAGADGAARARIWPRSHASSDDTESARLDPRRVRAQGPVPAAQQGDQGPQEARRAPLGRPRRAGAAARRRRLGWRRRFGRRRRRLRAAPAAAPRRRRRDRPGGARRRRRPQTTTTTYTLRGGRDVRPPTGARAGSRASSARDAAQPGLAAADLPGRRRRAAATRSSWWTPR